MSLSIYLSCQWRPENHGVYGFWETKFNIGIAPESLLKADRHGCLSPCSFSRGCIICCCCALEGGWDWGCDGKGNRVPVFSLLRVVQLDGGGCLLIPSYCPCIVCLAWGRGYWLGLGWGVSLLRKRPCPCMCHRSFQKCPCVCMLFRLSQAYSV